MNCQEDDFTKYFLSLANMFFSHLHSKLMDSLQENIKGTYIEVLCLRHMDLAENQVGLPWLTLHERWQPHLILS